jgi:hypothetical protein
MAGVSLTVAILEGLLSPDPALRSASEAKLSALSPEQKCDELLRIVPAVADAADAERQQHGATSAAGSSSLQQLICVLLRREALKVSSADNLLRLVDPLLGMFTTATTAGAAAAGNVPQRPMTTVASAHHHHQRRRRSAATIGDCLASVVQGLENGGGGGSLPTDAAVAVAGAVAAYQRILPVVATPVRVLSWLSAVGVRRPTGGELPFRAGRNRTAHWNLRFSHAFVVSRLRRARSRACGC